jgi:hypothetical protein
VKAHIVQHVIRPLPGSVAVRMRHWRADAVGRQSVHDLVPLGSQVSQGKQLLRCLLTVSPGGHSAGSGTGLYEILPNMTMVTRALHNSTYANRIMHPTSNQIIIGPYAIDLNKNLNTFPDLLTVRVG